MKLLKNRAFRALLGTACFAPLGLGAVPAFAQEAAEAVAQATDTAVPAEAETDEAEAPEREIVVTGSRVSTGFSAPTPVTVLGSDRVEALAITNVGDALNQLPIFRASSSPSTQAVSGGNIGARILDLRGLGAPRTLVLVDGKRFVPSTSQGTVDVNMIPSSLVGRTEVVTGGASAAYGSDAVSGVVNFIMKRDFNGVRAEAIAGISQRGDDGSQFLSFTAGTQIGSNLHVVLAGEYEKSDGLGTCYTRSWCATQTLILGNNPAGTGGLPANLILPNINPSTMAPGGLINRSYNAAGVAIGTAATDPLRGIAFTADGTPRAFQYGTTVGPLFMNGGEGSGRNPFIAPLLLKVPVERFSLYGMATLDLGENLTAKFDASYGRVTGTVISNVMRDYNASLLGRIQRDNPFIPTAIQAAMDANGVQSFILGKAGFDLGPSYATSKTETARGVFSLEGRISERWSWEAYYQYGRTDFIQKTYNAINLANLLKATDAVSSGGRAVCRVNADASTTNNDAACVAYNPFGEGRFDPAAAAYVTGDGFQKTMNDQHVVGATVKGDVIDLPAGPLSIAVGAEYRRDRITGTTDPVSLQNGFWTLNGSAIDGKVSTKELFGEVAVPVLKESSLGYALDLNGAIRRTDYSTTGAVTTWKVGAVYQPIEAIRLRASKSRDIRAPNLNELVGAQRKTTIGLSDPANKGLQTNPTVITGSNPNLSVERADNWTAGVVLSPRGGVLGRARLSVDYYNIKIKDAIGTLGAQTLVNRCFEGVQEFCGLITRDAGNTITEVRDIAINAAELRTSGWDVEFQYRQPLGGLGSLNASILANIVNNLTTEDQVGSIDRAGQNGVRTGTVAGVPDYTIDGTLTWKLEPVQLTAHGRYIPKGIYWTEFRDPSDAGYAVTNPNSVNSNDVPSRFYLDLAAQVTLNTGGREFELFGAINNALDRDPPIMPGASGGTNQILYDPVGRAFKIGVRAKFGGA